MVYVHFYYTKDLKKRKNQKILYSPENIKISFIFRHNPQDFGGMKSPSPALRGWGESQIPEKEKSVLVSENKFETEYTAARIKPSQTFTIILPNLIHKSKKRNLKKR